MSKRPYYILAIVFCIIVAAGCIALDYYITYKKGNVKQEAVLLVYKHSTYEALLDSLRATDAIDNWKSFNRAAAKEKLADSFKPGRYLIKEGMSNQAIIRTISLNWETPLKFAFRGYVRTLGRLAKVFSDSFEADSASFMAALQDSVLMDSLGFKAEGYIGMFIPNTYEIYWTSEPRSIIKRFKKEYDRFWNGERISKADAMGFSKEQVSTLASIVLGETNHVPEMPRIAGVYINRLNKKMPLQACPTIIFAHLETEPGITRVLKRHLKIDSPYNTYKHKGLPPGPVITPSIKAIDAVLNYEKTNYLYFCAKPEFDGTHNFAATYSQHRKNANAYQRAYNAREKDRKAAGKTS